MSEKWDHRANCHLQNWKDRKSRTENHIYWSRNPQEETSMRSRATIGKSELLLCWRLSVDEWVKNFGTIQCYRGPHAFANFTSRNYWVLMVNIEENIPLCFGSGQGKVTILKYARTFCSQQGLRRNYFPEPNLLWLYHILTYPGEEKNPTPASCSSPCEGSKIHDSRSL